METLEDASTRAKACQASSGGRNRTHEDLVQSQATRSSRVTPDQSSLRTNRRKVLLAVPKEYPFSSIRYQAASKLLISHEPPGQSIRRSAIHLISSFSLVPLEGTGEAYQRLDGVTETSREGDARRGTTDDEIDPPNARKCSAIRPNRRSSSCRNARVHHERPCSISGGDG